jgi:hypothetical protein
MLGTQVIRKINDVPTKGLMALWQDRSADCKMKAAVGLLPLENARGLTNLDLWRVRPNPASQLTVIKPVTFVDQSDQRHQW